MQALLLTIDPYDLERLMITAENVADVKSFESIQTKFLLGPSWQAIHYLLTAQDSGGASPLEYAITAQHAVLQHSSLTLQSATVRYNTVVVVHEIEQALSAITVGEFQQHFVVNEAKVLKVLATNGGVPSDTERSNLTLAFTQLQDFYQYAKRSNLAVISIISKDIGTERLI